MKKILIIEDDQEFVDLMLLVLEEFEKRAIRSLSELRQLGDFSPDIVFTDLSLLPGEDFHGIISKISEKFPYAEIIFVSGHHSLASVARAHNVRFLKKPFDMDSLVAMAS